MLINVKIGLCELLLALAILGLDSSVDGGSFPGRRKRRTLRTLGRTFSLVSQWIHLPSFP